MTVVGLESSKIHTDTESHDAALLKPKSANGMSSCAPCADSSAECVFRSPTRVSQKHQTLAPRVWYIHNGATESACTIFFERTFLQESLNLALVTDHIARGCQHICNDARVACSVACQVPWSDYVVVHSNWNCIIIITSGCYTYSIWSYRMSTVDEHPRRMLEAQIAIVAIRNKLYI